MAVQINGTTGITTPKLDALDLELGSKNVVERGSNANGNYARFADGTQICWANKSIATTISGVASGSWEYPATFAFVPTNVISILTSNPAAYLSGVGSDTTSNVQHYVWSNIAGVSISGRAVAVGRWF